jgi:hypothetical protein
VLTTKGGCRCHDLANVVPHGHESASMMRSGHMSKLRPLDHVGPQTLAASCVDGKRRKRERTTGRSRQAKH